MSIEMPAAEVYGLANRLRSGVADAEEVGVRLRDTPDVGGGLQTAVVTFLESHRAAGRALAGELTWLGDTVAAVVDSWVRLDGSLLDGCLLDGSLLDGSLLDGVAHRRTPARAE